MTCHPSSRWAPKLILFFSWWAIFEADGFCSDECCCAAANGAGVDCSGSRLPVLPPRPTPNKPSDENRRWCGDPPSNGAKVTEIDMRGSDASEISPDMYKDYPKLRTLILDYCKFTTLSKKFFYNQEHRIELRNLSIRSNHVEEIAGDTFVGLVDLLKIDLSLNKIKTLPVNVFRTLNLTEVLLEGNLISDLKMNIFESLTSLRMLDLAGNPIKTLQQFPKSLIHLSYLYLRNTSLSHLDVNVFEYLGNLGDLDLSYNKLENLPDRLLYRNIELYKINLSFNKLSYISRTFFHRQCKLSRLDLRHNRLTVVRFEWFSSVAINTHSKIREDPAMDGNPVGCNSNLEEYAILLNKVCYDKGVKEEKLLDHLNIQCPDGKLIDNETTCLTKVWNEGKKKEIFLAKNGTCDGNPYCPFQSNICAETQLPYVSPDLPLVATGDLIPYVFAVIGILIVISSALLIRAFRNKYTLVRRKESLRSTDSEDSFIPRPNYHPPPRKPWRTGPKQPNRSAYYVNVRQRPDGSSECTSTASSSRLSISEASDASETKPQETYTDKIKSQDQMMVDEELEQTQPKLPYKHAIGGQRLNSKRPKPFLNQYSWTKKPSNDVRPKVPRNPNPRRSARPRSKTPGIESQETNPKELWRPDNEELSSRSPGRKFHNTNPNEHGTAYENIQNSKNLQTQPKLLLFQNQNASENVYVKEFQPAQPNSGNSTGNLNPSTNAYGTPMNQTDTEYTHMKSVFFPRQPDNQFSNSEVVTRDFRYPQHHEHQVPGYPVFYQRPHPQPQPPQPAFSSKPRAWIPTLPAPLSMNQRNIYAEEIPHGLPHPDPNPNFILKYPERPGSTPYVIYQDHKEPLLSKSQSKPRGKQLKTKRNKNK